MRNAVHGSLIAVSLVAALLVGINAEAAGDSKGEGRFAVGLSYASGISEVSDFITDSFESSGYEIDELTIPVGLSLAGGYRFGFGGEIMVDAGPFAMVYIDAIGGTASGEYFTWDLPVGLTAGYAFFSSHSVSPYLRGGVRHHFAGGDFYDSSSPGLYVAGGINFFSNRAVQLQLEVAYDDATVKFEDFFGDTEEIKPGGLLVSIRAAF